MVSNSIWRTWGAKNPAKKKHPELFKSKKKTPAGVYNEEGVELGEQMKRFHWIHYFLKYKFFVPLVYMSGKLLGKKLVKKVPDRPHFTFVKMLDEAIERGQVQWQKNYLNARKGIVETEDEIRKRIKKQKYVGCQGIITLIRQIHNTFVTNDTAYMELDHFIMVEIAKAMNKYYEEHKASHLLYTSSGVGDMHYFALFPHIDMVKNKELKEVGVVKK